MIDDFFIGVLRVFCSKQLKQNTLSTKKNSKEIPSDELKNKDLNSESLGDKQLTQLSTDEVRIKDTSSFKKESREITVTFIKRHKLRTN